MELPKRKSPRAEWYDYAGGTYFVTVVTHNRQNYFGLITNGAISLSALGKCLDDELKNIHQHYRYATLLNHVVMPNHFHAIIYIEEDLLLKSLKSMPEVAKATSTLEKAHLSKSWLSTVVGGLKSHITRIANNHGITFSWQRRFHDHIIRWSADYNLISNYIDNNVENWDIDCFNG